MAPVPVSDPLANPLAAPQATARRLGAIAAEAVRHLLARPDRQAGCRAKHDGSPCSDADHASEALIVGRLSESWPFVPVVAEESAASRSPGRVFFLVDPLDGTRDFLDGTDEWAVAAALIADGRPVAATIASPFAGTVWIAGTRAEASSLADAATWQPIEPRAARGSPVALTSRRHACRHTEDRLDAFGVSRRMPLSSAAKFGILASGGADLYLRCGPTMEWDIAAGDHLVTVAGGRMVGPEGTPLTYGHAAEGFRAGPFLACADPVLAQRLHWQSEGRA